MHTNLGYKSVDYKHTHIILKGVQKCKFLKLI